MARADLVFDPPANPTKSTIKDIKVECLSLKTKLAYYTIYLNNCKVGNSTRVLLFRVGTVNHVWDAAERGEEPYICMMQNTRQAIYNAEKY